jgi:hypothetical protein
MKHLREPIDTIIEWQKCYKNKQVVASLDVPMASKDSRENLHDTSNTMTTILDPLLTTDSRHQLIVNNFSDTIVEAMADHSGAEIYKCFLQSAQENLKHCKKEYENAKQLVDYLTNQND